MTGTAARQRISSLFHRKAMRRSQKWLLAMIVIGLVIAVVALFMYHKKHSSHSHIPTYQHLSEHDLLDMYNNDIATKNYTAGINLINAQQDRNTPSNQVRLASLYAAQGNLTKALAIYASLEHTHTLTQDTAESAARVATQAKQYSLAVNYYKQAIRLSASNKNDPTAKAEANYYAQQIQALPKGGH